MLDTLVFGVGAFAFFLLLAGFAFTIIEVRRIESNLVEPVPVLAAERERAPTDIRLQ